MTTMEESLESVKNKNSESDLEHIKQWLANQRHLPSLSDDKLLTFLNSCDNSLEATESCIESYFTIKCSTPQFFSNRDPLSDEIQEATKCVRIVKLSAVSPEGYIYLLTQLYNDDPSLYKPDATNKLMMMIMDASLRDIKMAPGVVIISDIRGFSFTHALKMPMASAKKNMQYVQDAMPVKLRAMHAINSTYLINTILAIMKPFMKKEVLELLHFHYGEQGMEDLYKTVPKKFLPRDYGGEDDTVEELFKRTMEDLVKCRDWFKEEEEHCQVDESKREKKPEEAPRGGFFGWFS